MKSANKAEPPHRDYYIVTYDVASRLQSFRTETLSVPDLNDPRFEVFHRSLLDHVQQALPGVNVHNIHMVDLGHSIWEKIHYLIDHTGDQVVLSTCPEISVASQLMDAKSKAESHVLHFNRLFDINGEMLGYGSRPGFTSMDWQLSDLIARLGGRKVVLIEDGAFTGGTLYFVLSRLIAHGVRVSAVVVGFCTPVALGRVRQVFDGQVIVVNEVEGLIDWVPDHDLVPFTPNCGRVLGESTPQGFMPVRTSDGVTCAYPYILPFGKMGEWTSLPDDGARNLSRFCLEMSIDLFNEVGSYEGHQITIGELVRNYPRVSIPISIGLHEDLPSLDTKVTAFLKEALQKLK